MAVNNSKARRQLPGFRQGKPTKDYVLTRPAQGVKDQNRNGLLTKTIFCIYPGYYMLDSSICKIITYRICLSISINHVLVYLVYTATTDIIVGMRFQYVSPSLPKKTIRIFHPFKPGKSGKWLSPFLKEALAGMIHLL